MTPKRSAEQSRKACIRCSNQKRRCDKALPACELCSRLRQTCKYQHSRMSSMRPTPSPSPISSETLVDARTYAPSHLKENIMQRLNPFVAEDIFSSYYQTVDNWFPIISISRLRSQSPTRQDSSEASLEVVLICLCITLLTTFPPSSENEIDTSEYRSLYLFSKKCVAETESLGINGSLIVQSRVLVTLFEVAHGLYPAAFVSIGAAVRAADALRIHPVANARLQGSSDDDAGEVEMSLIWREIVILDRIIAVESGLCDSITRARSKHFHDALDPIQGPLSNDNHDHQAAFSRVSCLFEASSHLDKIQAAIPKAVDPGNLRELVLSLQTLLQFQIDVEAEIGGVAPLHVPGLTLCNIALLLAFEGGSKVEIVIGVTEDCSALAKNSLESLLATITNMFEPFTLGTLTSDFNLLPPFVAFLVYKAAEILTQTLLGSSVSIEKLKQLRVLRAYLRIIGERWLSCRRFLKLLDEDTTPRLLKALEK